MASQRGILADQNIFQTQSKRLEKRQARTKAFPDQLAGMGSMIDDWSSAKRYDDGTLSELEQLGTYVQGSPRQRGSVDLGGQLLVDSSGQPMGSGSIRVAGSFGGKLYSLRQGRVNSAEFLQQTKLTAR